MQPTKNFNLIGSKDPNSGKPVQHIIKVLRDRTDSDRGVEEEGGSKRTE